MSRINVCLDDLFCLAILASEETRYSNLKGSAKIFGISSSVLHASGKWILNRMDSRDYNIQVINNLLSHPKLSESIKQLSLCEAFEPSDLVCDSMGRKESEVFLKYLTVLFSAIRSEAMSHALGLEGELNIAIPSIISIYHPKCEMLPILTYKNGERHNSGCKLFLTPITAVTEDFILGGLGAGFGDVSVDWVADLLAKDAFGGLERPIDETKDVLEISVIVEVYLSGLVISPILLSTLDNHSITPRPCLYVPIDFKIWIKGQLETSDNQVFSNLTINQQNDYVDYFLTGLGFRNLGSESCQAQDSRLTSFEEVRLSDFGLDREVLVCNLANCLFGEIYDFQEDKKKYVLNSNKVPNLDSSRYQQRFIDNFKMLTSVMKSETEENDLQSIVISGFKATGTLVSHPFFGEVINEACKLLLWNPGDEKPPADETCFHLGESAILCDGTQKSRKGINIWSNVTASFQESGYSYQSEEADLTDSSVRPYLFRILCIDNRKEELSCCISLMPSDGSDTIDCMVNFGLQKRHVLLPIEVEVQIDRTDLVKVTFFMDGELFQPSKFECLDDNVIVKMTEYGQYEIAASARHLRISRSMRNLWNSKDSPWLLL